MDLPPEIIEIISLSSLVKNHIPASKRDPRLILTQICSQWRAVALAHPASGPISDFSRFPSTT
ncbi:hypothetical protein BD779DRAFT_1787138 [Infundibulicybe gibba]|nr:hypothetical protein BD779DRAFT_1787138 [Infundibulicybe gibba]